MSTINVAVVNCSQLSFDEFQRGVEVLQTQLDQHFTPAWGTAAALAAVDGSTIAYDVAPGSALQDHWSLAVLDGSTGAQVRDGYRDLTRFGLPQAKVLIQADAGAPRAWTSGVSRALLELLANPRGVELASVDCAPRRRLVLVQVCAPVANDTYVITHASGVAYRVADFVLRSWFDPAGAAPFAHQVALAGPQAASPNGGSSILYLTGDSANAGQWLLSTCAGGGATTTVPLAATASSGAARQPAPAPAGKPAPVPAAPAPAPAPAAPPPPPAPTVQPNDYFLPP